jgi:hypothetical protein
MECAVWEKPTNDGRCIAKWWAGPPATWVIDGLSFAIATTVFAFVLAHLQERGYLKKLPAKPNRRKLRGPK